jgi:hypothetical protein
VRASSAQNSQGPNASGQRTPSTTRPLSARKTMKNTIVVNTQLNGRNTKKLARKKKMELFETMKSISIERFSRTSSDILEFIVDSKIVEDIIAQLFFPPNDDLDALSLEKSMALFKKVLDTTTSYCITVKNVKGFELALDHSSIGLSFRQTFVVIDQHKEVFGNVKLVGVNDHIVSQYVHVGVAINLQRIPNILSSPRVWSFALVADSSTHQSVSDLDIRNPRLSQWFSGESAPDRSALLRLSYSKEHYCHDLSHFGCVVCMLAI